jgi:hypothetical protein
VWPITCRNPNGMQVAFPVVYSLQNDCQSAVQDRTLQLKSLAAQDVVRMLRPDSWGRKVTLLEEVAPRSYQVRTEDGAVYRDTGILSQGTQEKERRTNRDNYVTPGTGSVRVVSDIVPQTLRRSQRPPKRLTIQW